jgi:hypothetical protein
MKPAQRKPVTRAVARHEQAFREIIGLIAAARWRAFQAVNTELIQLYWRVGRAKVSPVVTQMSFRPIVAPAVRQFLPIAKTLTTGETIALNDRPHPGPLPREREKRSLTFSVARVSYCSLASCDEEASRSDRRFNYRIFRIGQSLFPLLGGEGQGEGECQSQSPLCLP